MGIANSMKELTQDIISSSEERTDKLFKLKKEAKELRRDATGMVKDFSTSRRAASRQLRQQLAQSKADLSKQVEESRDNAKKLIKDFGDSRKQSGAQLRKELAQNDSERKKQVQGLIEDFKELRHDASYHLGKELAESKAQMKSAVRETLADAGSLIKGYHSSRRTMGARLKNDLGKDRNGRKTEVRGMLGEFKKAQREVTADLNKATDSWKEMTLTIHHKKAHGRALPGTGTPAGIAPDLKEKLLSIINQQDNGGITLSEVADTLGVATVTLSKAAKTLQEEGNIRREGRLYFSLNK